MTRRTYDLMLFLDLSKTEEYYAEFTYPFDDDVNKRLFDWIESFVTGPYVALQKNIYFSSEEDRNFFMLGYDKEKYRDP